MPKPISSLMKVVCAWCRSVMRTDAEACDSVSHGICAECAYTFVHGTGVGLRRLIQDCGVPVLLVDGDATLRGASSTTAAALGKPLAGLERQRIGVVIGCERSASKEGCGRSLHCGGCSLRAAVSSTHRDGLPRHGVVSEHPLSGTAGQQTLHLRFSTTKLGDTVLLALESVETASLACPTAAS